MVKADHVNIRIATTADAAALLAIYAPYVKETAITFEYDVPSLEEFRSRIKHTLQRYPYIVVEETGTGRLLGYAYLSAFVGRAAYDWSAETSIYLAKDSKGHGLGRRLYEALERLAKAQNILNLNACIGYPIEPDEYLDNNSAQFHQHLGYRMVGKFTRSGYKFGRWYDMIWMEKLLGKHPAKPLSFIPFPSLSRELVTELLYTAPHGIVGL